MIVATASAIVHERRRKGPKEVTNQDLSDLLVALKGSVELFKQSVEKDLRAIQLASEQRDKMIEQINTQINEHVKTVGTVLTDMAILRTQHSSFWKGVGVLAVIIPALAGAIAWVIATLQGKAP